VLAVAGGGTKIFAWGSNSQGQLGDGSIISRSTPVLMSTQPGGVLRVVAGEYHSLALLKSGQVLAWGFNRDGQLGDGTTEDRHTPVFVKQLGGRVLHVYLASGGLHNIALLDNGELKAWGSGNKGQLGIGGNQASLFPVTVQGLQSSVTSAAVGRHHSLAISGATGALQAWGSNVYGQVASSNTAAETLKPGAVILEDVLLVEAGWYHSFAIKV